MHKRAYFGKFHFYIKAVKYQEQLFWENLIQRKIYITYSLI